MWLIFNSKYGKNLVACLQMINMMVGEYNFDYNFTFESGLLSYRVPVSDWPYPTLQKICIRQNQDPDPIKKEL